MSKGNSQVVVRLPDDDHGRWKQAAAKAGVPLSVFIRQSVERVVSGEVVALMPRGKDGQLVARRGVDVVKTAPLIDPAKCVKRQRAGAYCRFCGSVHARGF